MMLLRNDGKSKIIIIVVAVVLVLACAIGGIAVMKAKKAHGAKEKVPEGPISMVPVGEMVVNLADSEEIRYLKVDTMLEVCGKVEGGGGGGEGEGPGDEIKVPLRDAIIAVLSSKTMAELNQPGGKEALKKELTAACNKHLPEAKVKNIYFNEFAMQ